MSVRAPIENGDILKDVTQSLAILIDAVRETSKKAKFTMTVELVPTNTGSIDVHAEFQRLEPRLDRPSTTFFMIADYTLDRDDPSQQGPKPWTTPGTGNRSRPRLATGHGS